MFKKMTAQVEMNSTWAVGARALLVDDAPRGVLSGEERDNAFDDLRDRRGLAHELDRAAVLLEPVGIWTVVAQEVHRSVEPPGAASLSEDLEVGRKSRGSIEAPSASACGFLLALRVWSGVRAGEELRLAVRAVVDRGAHERLAMIFAVRKWHAVPVWPEAPT